MIKTVFLVLCAFGLFVWFNGSECKITKMSVDEFERVW